MSDDLDPNRRWSPGETIVDRFEVVEQLGEGSAGIVYGVTDLSRGVEVALKTLRLRDAEFLYLLKREFRTLTNLVHPNLVTLHELVVDDHRAFITMELVRGVHWLDWVRPQGQLDEARLRESLGQLATGLHHLHCAGLVHRDVKPTNVLVTPQGHVKLLDFGLAFAAESAPDPSDAFVAGTLDYLSPEQAAGQPVTAASDGYALGVLAYEALTGRTPWPELDARALLKARITAEPELPEGADVPEDLALLSLDLRLVDPSLRPSADEVLRTLGAGTAPQRWASTDFVGRTVERSRLSAAVEAALRARGPRLLTVSGTSGTGKSAVTAEVLAALERTPGVLVLRGQCFEREAVRYSGIDAVVDALRTYLLSVEPETLEDLLPAGARALASAFPVLADLVESSDDPLPSDPLEQLRAARDGFRDLVVGLAKQLKVVLFIDDLHWCGPETTRLLLHLLDAPSPVPFCVLGTYRVEMLDRRASLTTLLTQAAQAEQAWQLALLPLPFEEARQLAATRLARDASDALCATIARESDGTPLFIEELVRHVNARGGIAGARHIGLEAMTQARVHELPEPHRKLLQLAAVAGSPISQRVAVDASGRADGAVEQLAELRAAHFIRTFGPTPEDLLETYHGRVRNAVLETLDAETTARRHHALACAFERDNADAEVLAFHFARSGEPQRALVHRQRAAELAMETLAFARAARLAQEALAALAANAPQRAALERLHGDALSNDGRGKDAAEAYLRAAAAQPDTSLELRQRAAEQYLRSGYVTEGLPLLRGVLGDVGLRLARSPRHAVGSWLLQRASIALGGTTFRPVAESDADPADLLRVDICWTAATGLPSVDVMLGQDQQARHLRLALQVGEPRRVARALSLEILYTATSGTRNQDRVDNLIERVRNIATDVCSPHVDGLLAMATGVACAYRGEFRGALEHLHVAADVLRTRCNGVAWERSFTSTFEALSMLYLGEFARFVETIRTTSEDARARDDLSTQLMVRVGYDYLRHLLLDDPDAARAELEDSIAWRPDETTTPTYRYTALMARGRIERYAGDAAASYACFEEHLGAVRRSMMLTKQPFLLYFSFERACGALWAARAQEGAARSKLLAVARKDMQAIRAEKTGWGEAFVAFLQASLHSAHGRVEESMVALRAASEASLRTDMRLYAAAAEARLAELERRPAPAGEAFLHEGVRNVARMIDMHAPPVIGW